MASRWKVRTIETIWYIAEVVHILPSLYEFCCLTPSARTISHFWLDRKFGTQLEYFQKKESLTDHLKCRASTAHTSQNLPAALVNNLYAILVYSNYILATAHERTTFPLPAKFAWPYSVRKSFGHSGCWNLCTQSAQTYKLRPRGSVRPSKVERVLLSSVQ